MASEQDHHVGYGRPPIATQFKPGRSGNPSGRPKRTKSLQAELLAELGEVVRVREGANDVEISKARAIAKSLVRAAVDGNMRAASLLVSFCAKNLGDADDTDDNGSAPEDIEILNDYVARELRRSERDATAEPSQMETQQERNLPDEK